MAINKKEYFSDSKGKSENLGEFIIIFMDRLLHMFTNLFNRIFLTASELGMATTNNKESINSENIHLYKHGSIFNYAHLRYLVTILVPPLGVFMSKGIYGWVNIIMALFFCYIHYFVGILYALVITHNSKYADLYEKKQEIDIKRIKNRLKNEEDLDIDNNKGELIVMVIFLLIFIGLFVLVIYLK